VPVALFRGSLLDLVVLDVPLVALEDTVPLPLDLLGGTTLEPVTTDLPAFFVEVTLAGELTVLFALALEGALPRALVTVVARLVGVATAFLAVERPFAAALLAPDVVRWLAFFLPMIFFATGPFAAFRVPLVAGVRLVAMVTVGQVPR
jgi:hypothetical protein